jgi:uncharacterized membrane protein HdeD (DUF308 family)
MLTIFEWKYRHGEKGDSYFDPGKNSVLFALPGKSLLVCGVLSLSDPLTMHVIFPLSMAWFVLVDGVSLRSGGKRPAGQL